MNKIFKRIGTILLALTLCFGTTLTAFAAEEGVEVNETTVTYSDKIASGKSENTFTTNDRVYVSLTNGNWSADFEITILPATNASFTVTLTTPSGDQYVDTVIADGIAHHFRTLTYAPAGTYTIYFLRQSGSSANYKAFVDVYD